MYKLRSIALLFKKQDFVKYIIKQIIKHKQYI